MAVNINRIIDTISTSIILNFLIEIKALKTDDLVFKPLNF